MSAGVPTVWQGLLAHVKATAWHSARCVARSSAARACPPAMMRAFQEQFDVQVLHAWGMTR